MNTHRTQSETLENITTPSPEAFQLARNYLRAVALEKAIEVNRQDVSAALRLLALQISAPPALPRGCLVMECSLCLS